MSKCPDCKIKYNDIQNFCHWCGTPLIKSKILKFSKEENAFYERGRIHFLRGASHIAQKEFETLLKINRRDADAYYQLGRIYEQTGQKKKALKLYRRCLTYDRNKKWETEISPRIKNLEEK
jgi:tetratricopeptide (TPR) repeat protein